MWPLVFAGAAGLFAFMTQSKRQSSEKKTYEMGLKDGEESVKKRQDDEKKEELRISKLVEKRLSERESSSVPHRSRIRRTVNITDEGDTTEPPNPEGEKK